MPRHRGNVVRNALLVVTDDVVEDLLLTINLWLLLFICQNVHGQDSEPMLLLVDQALYGR